MSITYTRVPAGHWFEVAPDYRANKGRATGMIYPPDKTHPWRLTFAACTGHAAHLQGKVLDFQTLAAAKHQLHQQFLHF